MIPIDLVFIDDEINNKILIQQLTKKYNNDYVTTYCFDQSDEGLEFIMKTPNQLILVLDLKMREHELQGIEILKKVREKKHIIPVIIKSGNNEVSNDEFLELINNGVSYFVRKGTATSKTDEEESIHDAIKTLMGNVSVALDEYVKRNPDRKKIIIASKSSTLEDLVEDVRLKTPMGIDFEKAIYKLAIDMLGK